jgi:hypothetical protein
LFTYQVAAYKAIAIGLQLRTFDRGHLTAIGFRRRLPASLVTP